MSGCFCDGLHVRCKPGQCDRAGAADPGGITLGELANGCRVCKVLARGLILPEIKAVWRSLGGEWQPDENKLRVAWPPGTPDAHGRALLRTLGSDDGTYWRHFVFTLDPDAPDRDGLKCPGFRKLPHHPLRYTGSPEAMNWLRAWLSDCNTDHDCNKKEAPALPDRVLAIRGNRVVVESGCGRRAFYTTVSHCWGRDSPMTLTTENYTSLTSDGIALSSLPQTYQDAIAVTMQLDKKVDYIWVDSLCIIQDNETDWQTQAAKMMTVYGNSYLNIAAKHAANAHESCFAYPKEELPHKAFRIPDSDVLVREAPRPSHHDFAIHHVDKQAHPDPLLKRCWVLQERLLAPRVIYFDRNELLWECGQNHDCQCGAMGTMAGFKDYWTSALSPGPRAHFGREHPITAWLKVLAKYTSMQLTVETDRLLALDGLVQQMLRTDSVGDYVAGTFTHRLERQVT